MLDWKQVIQNLIRGDCQEKEEQGVFLQSLAIKSTLAFAKRQEHFGDVVASAFREIKEVFEDQGYRVWIDGSSLIIGCVDIESGDEEYTKAVKYEIVLLGPMRMTSRMYLMLNLGPERIYPIEFERSIVATDLEYNITDVTSKDIIDDFKDVFMDYIGAAPSLKYLYSYD